MMTRILLAGIMLFSMIPLSAQVDSLETEIPVYRFRLYLTDKKKNDCSLKHPEKFLSAQSLERRKRQRLTLNDTDLPISTHYLKKISKAGVKVISKSKWTNTVVIETSDSVYGSKLAEKLSFVRESRCVWCSPKPYGMQGLFPSFDKKYKQNIRSEHPYGEAYEQCAQIGADRLHEAGFRGKGMTIAVIDGGFQNADSIELFRNTRILGTANFVYPHTNLFDEHSHGTMVMSCMGANVPHYMIGTAPEASYWLLRSEDMSSEQPIEMDYWAAAIEFADSVGVDLVNSSLGYNKFDNPNDCFRYWHLDGKTLLISEVASMAAEKGMLVVNSAGNAGYETWRKLLVPGDANHILTVGAVDKHGTGAGFSSIGYSADGRVKPDVCALGAMTVLVNEKGIIDRNNGTSFSAPVMCGGVACLWQALPHLTVKEVLELVRRHGDNAEHPDCIYGYGVPDLWKAYQEYIDM